MVKLEIMNKKDKQKKLWVVIALVAVVIIGVIVMVNRNKGGEETVASAEPVVQKKRISAPVNVLDLSLRPVVSLQPFTQAGGRFVSIVLSELREPATVGEYEIVYNVTGASAVSATGAKVKVPDGEGEGTQGFMGELDLASLPTSTENRFGTCSAGGACVNNSVSGGSLTINFEGTQKFAVASNWTYFEEGTAENVTTDGVFSLVADELVTSKDYLIMETMGLPENLPGQATMVSDGGKDGGTKPVAYQINFTNAPAATEAVVTFTGEDSDGFAYAENKVAVWNGTEWANFEQTEPMPVGDGYLYVLLTKS